jgi:hypothetical protein
MRALFALLILAAAMAVGGCNSTASPSPTVAPVTTVAPSLAPVDSSSPAASPS